MRPLPFVWPYALAFWAVFIWAMVPEFRIVRNARRNQTSSDARSLQVITQGGGIAAFFAFFLAKLWRILPAHAVAVFVIGVGLVIAGSLLRRHCWKMLGRSFTGDVRAEAGQAVVTEGAYRLLRHPSYTAGIVLNIGTGIALGSWLSTAIFAIASLVVYTYRMNVEEAVLL